MVPTLMVRTRATRVGYKTGIDVAVFVVSKRQKNTKITLLNDNFAKITLSK